MNEQINRSQAIKTQVNIQVITTELTPEKYERLMDKLAALIKIQNGVESVFVEIGEEIDY